MSLPEKKITMADIIVLSVIFCLLIISVSLLYFPKKTGDTVRITTADNIIEYPLDSSEEIRIESNGETLRVVIENNTVRIAESSCPDLVCVHTGAISSSGKSIVCIPAKVIIEISGKGGSSDEDFIVG